ncbi:MAG: glutamate--tRNA ligase [Candidatus Midichloria sp.]|nr:MAG: glutamate--tRNA ligase [Candidatus Midichloria sp.]
MSVITRFAPSPTGFLHIGGARTALFNWLFSKANNGKFLLRIEDTDRERSTQEAVDAIIGDLKWLKIDWDNGIVMQFSRSKHYAEVAEQLLDTGFAYRCYLSAEEIQRVREKDPYIKIESPWRDGKKEASLGIKPTIRLKVDKHSQTTVEDQIRGSVTISNNELDDMILLRSDGTPTYMLAVVVDDYDMHITHVIRGDDHFTNTFRQQQIIKALSWPTPVYAHVPLIHGLDGTKLSKRHGALRIDAYKQAGYLPEAICNYLLRLGWGSGNLEIITKEEASKLFTLEGLNEAPARFDYEKLNFLNAHYISKKSDADLIKLLKFDSEIGQKKVEKAISDLKIRVNTLVELQELADLYSKKKDPMDNKSQEIINSLDKSILIDIKGALEELINWETVEIKRALEELATKSNLSNGKMMQIMRASVVGSFRGPGIYKTMAILGKEEVMNRICT